ncbi:MAG: PQQ-dependent sugar dehydrogenase [Myxococcota bacterium]
MRAALLIWTLLSCHSDSDQTKSPQDGPDGVAASETQRSDDELSFVRLPPGFIIQRYASVPNARSMALGTRGTLFVGNRSGNAVYAVRDLDGDGRGEDVRPIARLGNMPNGVAFRNGDLFVAQVSRVVRFKGIEELIENPPEPEVVNDTFPTERHHGWKFIRFSPDGWLYVPVGAPCNVCLEEDERFASIMRMKPDGTELEVYAHGVRNSVGFDWHPETGELWFTDNGRDWLGDDRPPDELNRAPTAGLHFGFPFCHGGRLSDPEFGDRRRCDEFKSPAQALGPHVAALGMRFYRGTQFPAAYRGQIFIAEHGSWNRTEKIGYRVTMVQLNADGTTTYKPFASGWLGADGAERGRPVDVLVTPEGSLLVSDDAEGAVYRISYVAT